MFAARGTISGRTSVLAFRFILKDLCGVCCSQQQNRSCFSTLLRSGRYDFEPWESASLPLHQAKTMPASWYTDVPMLELEHNLVFRNCWQILGHSERLQQAGDFFTGALTPQMPFLVCKDQHMETHAFHNVCRHHAAVVASGSGSGARCFQCPYHGWTYGLDGRLQKAIGLKGIEGFKAADNGLVPLQMASAGPWLFAACGGEGGARAPPSLRSWLGEGGWEALLSSGACRQGMVHVAQRTYSIQCNWKVFCDNYLDGGYHVPVAHPDLAKSLDMGAYTSTLYERMSIQSCTAKGGNKRVSGGLEPAYIFIFPNLMINSYGPWIDTNVVIPTGPTKCQVIFDYYLEAEYSQDEKFIKTSLIDSEQVQQEDMELCKSVQSGLSSPAYGAGRYVPRFEAPMFHFHQMLHDHLNTKNRIERA